MYYSGIATDIALGLRTAIHNEILYKRKLKNRKRKIKFMEKVDGNGKVIVK